MKLLKDSLLHLSLCWNSHHTWRLQHDGANQKVMSWAQLEAPETPVAFHASATTTNKTNKQDKQKPNTEPRLNPVCLLRCSKKYFWTGSEVNPLVSPPFQQPKAWCSSACDADVNPTFFFSPGKKIGNFDFSVFILSFHLRKCQSWLQKGRKMTVIQYGNQPLSPYCYTLVITFLLVCIASEKKNTLCCYGWLFLFIFL